MRARLTDSTSAPLADKLRGFFLKHGVASKDDAYDLTQDVFVVLLQRRDSLDQPLNIEAYAVGVAKRLLTKYFRKKSVAPEELPEALVSDNPSPLDDAIRREWTTRLYKVLAKAVADGVTTNALYVRLHRARKQLGAPKEYETRGCRYTVRDLVEHTKQVLQGKAHARPVRRKEKAIA